MRRIGLAIIALAAGGFLGCQKAEQADVSDKLEKIDKRLASIEKKIASGAGAAAPARPQRRPGPDPKKVYSAGIEGAAWRGAEHAKVTIVGAMEFA